MHNHHWARLSAYLRSSVSALPRHYRTLVLLCLGGILLTTSGCGFSWWESYRYNKKEPYDLFALYQLLEERSPGLVFNQDTISGLVYDSSLVNNYVYVGINMFFDEADVTELLNFVEDGNKAFLVIKNIPEDISYHLFGPQCFYYDTYYADRLDFLDRDTVQLFLNNEALLPTDSTALSFVYDHRPVKHGWAHVPDNWLCDPGFGNEILGTLDSGLVNFMRLRYGEGEIILHTNPELFTNYYLSDSSRMNYAMAVFSYLGDGPVIWDEYARSYHLSPDQRRAASYNPNGGRNLLTENHALRYILEQPPLALAWYLFMIGGFLYVIFRGKRRQRVIPFRTKPENTSRQFVDTISRLTLQRGNHAKLAQREVKMLRQFLQEKFNVKWAEGEEFPPDLHQRIGLAQEVIDHANTQIRFVSRRDYIEEGDLVLFYRAIHPIYNA